MIQTLIENSTCAIVEKPENLPLPIEQDFTHSLKRFEAPIISGRNRPIYFYSPFTGDIITPTGRRFIPKDTDLITILELTEKHCLQHFVDPVTHLPNKRSVTLYLVAGRDEKNRPGWKWLEDMRDGWKLSKPIFKKVCQAEYEHDVFKVYLIATGNYFGEEFDLDTIIAAWKSLEKQLSERFYVGVHLASTPASTGRELLHVSLPYHKEYPRLPRELIELLYFNLRHQGRVETFPPQVDVVSNGVFVLDGRFEYASCVSNLPAGPCYRDKCNEFLAVRKKDNSRFSRDAMPGFYYATVRVPAGWSHIGLLRAPYLTKDGNAIYPREPGKEFTNWFTSSELALAIDNGWHVHIIERIIWPYTSKVTDPLKTWITRLRDFRAELEPELKVKDDRVLALQKDAIRNIVMHMIGSLIRVCTLEDAFQPLKDMPFPCKAYNDKFVVRDGVPGYEYQYAREFTGFNRRCFVHPEWPAIAYGRARASLAAITLRFPFESIVSLRTDSLWIASINDDIPALVRAIELEDVEKHKRPGNFRLKDRINSPWPWPVDSTAMAKTVRKRNIEKKDTDAQQTEIEQGINYAEIEEE